MNILFTCVGRRTYLIQYFKNNLQKEDKIFAVDMQLSAPALQVADVKIQVPDVYANNYIEVLLNICKTNKINAIISLNDLELPILSKNIAEFNKIGVTMIVSTPDVIDICFDKYKTFLWIQSLGLKAPKTYLHLKDVKQALAVNEISFPLFIKPRWGSGSIGLESIENMEELNLYYCLLKKKLKKTILANVSKGNEYILIQEKLTGSEYGIDVINDLKGNYITTCMKQKLAMRSGETDKAIIVNIPEIKKIGETIGHNLKHISNLDVDIMQRANGDYCVLEMNPRFGGGFPFSYEAGVNLPKAIIEWLKGNTIDKLLLTPTYGKMFAKNDYLLEIK